MTLEERIAELEAENAALRKQMTVLAAQVQDLQARLAKDSHNSSKPPGSDGLARKTKSLRRRSGKKPGGQLGHRGETLRLVVLPDEIVEHRPVRCAGCQMPLSSGGTSAGAGATPGPRAATRAAGGHRASGAARALSGLPGGDCRPFPAEVPSRVQYGPRLRALAVYLLEQQLVPYGRVRELLADLFGAELSVGTLVEWVARRRRPWSRWKPHQGGALPGGGAAQRRDWGAAGRRLAWAHVASTKQLTHYGVHPKRGAEATTDIGILPGFQGVSVHDGWKPYRAHSGCRHALCNIHHLRELTFLEEQYHQPWAKELKDLLREMKAATEQARTAGAPHLPQAERDSFVARYEELLATGLAANPPPPRPAHHRGRQKQSPARNLLERLWLGQDEVLAFLDDLTIPFDNDWASYCTPFVW